MGAVASRMAESIVHRGPDDQGVWVDEAGGVALAHRRLSILDLSPAGHQPMLSRDGRYVVVFNGEIYNHLDLRKELEVRSPLAVFASGREGGRGDERDDRPGWRGRSDTETMLAAIVAWGLEAALKAFVGMFAFALWDRQAHILTLARDRLGEKPLYYGWQKGAFLFGSELKALKAHPAFDGVIDRDALALFLRHNAVPAPYSVYVGIRKLPPGTYLQVGKGGEYPHPAAYWSARSAAEAGQRDLFRGDAADAAAELESRLLQAVGGQMVADVPLGAFLSGGIDSSTVVALMQTQSARPVKTFTIGFNEAAFNEAEYALAIARHLGTEHTELYVTPQEAMDVIPSLSSIYDEPLGDASQIPTFLVARLARSHVTVSLSGDGGDEVFGGYSRYSWPCRLWRKVAWMPRPLRLAIAGALTVFPPLTWNAIFKGLARLAPRRLRYSNPGDRLHQIAGVIAGRSPEEIYLGLVSRWKEPTKTVPGSHEPVTVITDRASHSDLPDLEYRMMYLDTVSYLPDDILTKVDRASMAVSLESRIPLLDHRVVEFAWSLPLEMKVSNGQGKRILRQVLYRHVPRELVERPKAGFNVPINVWLRGPIKAWAAGLLDKGRLLREGVFDPAPIQRKWEEHQSGKRDWAYYLWDVLMFQQWHEATFPRQ